MASDKFLESYLSLLKLPVGVDSQKEDIIGFVFTFELLIVYFGLAVVGIDKLGAEGQAVAPLVLDPGGKANLKACNSFDLKLSGLGGPLSIKI